MKKLFTILAVAAAMVSCAKEDVVSVQEPAQIAFEGVFVENATRANDPSTTTNNIENFYVWAVMDTELGIVFDDEEVKRNGSQWSYMQTQYWAPGHDYYFSAIAGDRSNDQIVLDLGAEHKKGMAVAGLGTATFTNVDGTNDFLYAEYNTTTPAEITSKPAAVKFTFDHLLSKVKFTFENGFYNDNNTVVVKNIKMVVPQTANIDLTQNTYAWTGHEGTTTLDMGHMANGANLAMAQSASSDNERLTIPAGAAQEYIVTFDVELWMGEVLATTASKEIKISGVELLPGRAYNFKAEINHQNVDENPLFEIEFEVEVNEWENAGGVALEGANVETAEDLAAALMADVPYVNVVLLEDIDLPISSLGQQTGGSGEYKLGGENTKAIDIDLNGKKLNITTNYWSSIGAKNDDAIFTIKNGTMTSSQATGTWNSYDLTFANCNYVIEDVDFEKAVAFTNSGKNVSVKNVTIKESHDYYAMWISAKGQNVTIDGLTIESDGRGIKIDEQYVSAPACVTLNVANSKFTTAKKSAILVKSVAGAVINWGEGNDISGVAADNEFAVWVDEDAKAYADKVVVNGALCKVEGTVAASSADELVEALANGKDVILTEDIATTSLIYVEGNVFDGNGHVVTPPFSSNDCGIMVSAGTVQNLTIKDAPRALGTGNSGSFVMTDDVYFKNVTTVGSTYGINISGGNGKYLYVDNCTLGDWNSYAGLAGATFTNCTFIAQGLYKAAQRVYGNVTFTFDNCTFPTSDPYDNKGYYIDGEDGKPTIIFKNCKLADGTPITSEVLKNKTYFQCSNFNYKFQ